MKNALIIILFTLSTAVSATTYYIDPAGIDNAGRNGTSQPWKTLAYASTRVTTSGDIIHVGVGTFHEDYQSIVSPGVSIVGAGVTSIIEADVHATGTWKQNALILLVSSIEGTLGNQSIHDLKFNGLALTCETAIVVQCRSNVDVYNCTFIDFTRRAIAFYGGAFAWQTDVGQTYAEDNTFHDNIVTNCSSQEGGSGAYGQILIQGQKDMLIYNNSMTQGTRAAGTNGEMISGVEGWFKGLKIYNNTMDKAVRSGEVAFTIELWYVRGGCEIYDNTLSMCVDVARGIVKGDYDFSVKIYDNEIGGVDETDKGVIFEHSVSDALVYNNLIKNVVTGIELSSAYQHTFNNIKIYYNILQDISIDGISFYYSEAGQPITYNDIYILNNVMDVGRDGIYLPTNATGTAKNFYIKNNIIINGSRSPIIGCGTGCPMNNLVIQNNIFYGNGNANNVLFDFGYSLTNYTNSGNIKSDPLFIDASTGNFHLQTGSPAIDAGIDVGLALDYEVGNPPDIGAFETPPVFGATVPVYTSSVVENATPARLDMTYNFSLANIVPAASAFTVQVNSVTRTVNTVAISGTKVLLTLASAVLYGDVVTVAYTKPSANPLQTTSGGQAASISAQTVTNKVTSLSPVYVSSAIENATPAVLEMTYNLSLANIVPATSAFTVRVNSVARIVNSAGISGTKVILTLASAVVYGDVVTVAYTKPSNYLLQTTSGGQAASISAQTVTNKVTVLSPVYVSSAIENATSAVLEMTYSLSLANIVPATSAFAVQVNSVARTVNSVSVSGTKVLLTLASAVVYGDVVSVVYTKPSANPLQTTSGGQAASISAQPVTNKVTPIGPVYASSAIENATPGVIEMIYNLSLANIVPATSAFAVQVNSVARTVNSAGIYGTKVILTLASAVVYGDVVTVAYTKPSSNPLQTTSGGQAASISAQTVTNNCLKPTSQNDPPILVTKNMTSSYSGFVGEIDASGSYDPNNDILTYEWTVPSNVSVSSISSSKILFLAPGVNTAQNFEFQLKVNDGRAIVSRSIPIKIMPYKPELTVAKIANIEASSYNTPDYPNNIADGNTATKWSVNGVNQWIVLKLAEPFKISHLELAFLQGQKNASYFEIFASKDKLIWDPILTKTASCNFSGDRQVFDFPASKNNIEYLYLKLVGHGNSFSTWNNFSECKIFGFRHQGTGSGDAEKMKIIIYPNPAQDFFNISIEEPTLEPDLIRIIDYSGKIVFKDSLKPGIKNIQIQNNLNTGLYIVELRSGSLTLDAQKLMIN
jgi:uncharacterized repeat protein (TIGR02059 family)